MSSNVEFTEQNTGHGSKNWHMSSLLRKNSHPNDQGISKKDQDLGNKDHFESLKSQIQRVKECKGPTVIDEQLSRYSEVVVWYVGTIALPKDSRIWDHRVHSVSHAIKRLKDSRVTHTLVRLNLSVDGIRLYDSGGQVLVHRAPHCVANFGVSPVDDTLFCLVTFDDEGINAGLSCQIFSVDPHMAAHKVHQKTAHIFGICCEINIDDNCCVEFPSSAQKAVDLFRRFYFEVQSGFNQSISNLDGAVFIPPGFEGQLNVNNLSNSFASAFHKDSDSNEPYVLERDLSPDMTYLHIHDLDSTISSKMNDMQYKKVQDELEKTAVFPAEPHSASEAIINGIEDSVKLNDALKSVQLMAKRAGDVCFRHQHDVGPLDVALHQDFSMSDQELNDSQNSAINLRKQSQKILQPHSESKGISLHVSRFNAIETNLDDPESPLPVLPLRAKTDFKGKQESQVVFDSMTSTPYRSKKSTVRSQDTINMELPTKSKYLAVSSKLPNPGKQARVEGLMTGRNLQDHSNSTALSRKSVKSDKKKDLHKNVSFHPFDSDAPPAPTKFSKRGRFPENDIKIKSFQKLNESGKPSQQNLSFHGSFESIFCDGWDNPEPTTKFLGSCRDLVPQSLEEVGRTASWAVAFDNLLSDGIGLATFREHLKKEFSEENISFWLKCEEYKKLPQRERKSYATEIFRTCLDPLANECVNVDQDVVTVVKNSLHLAAVDLFDAAQKHIYLLMKQDSYPRFKTSQLYKDAVIAEMEGKPCQFIEEDLTPVIKSKTLLDSKNVVNIDTTLSDGSVVSLQGRHGQKIAHVLLQLGDKLKFGLTFTEASDPRTNLVLDVTKDVKTLSAKEIHLIDCVVFRLTLPNEKSLAVRVRHKQTISKCLGPILRKHGFSLEKVVMHIAGTGVILKDKMFVDSLDCSHILAESLFDSKEKKKGNVRYQSAAVSQQLKSSLSFCRSTSSMFEIRIQLEEVFRDVFDGDVDFSFVVFDELGSFNLEKLSKPKYKHSSHRLSFLPRLSVDRNKMYKDNIKKPSTCLTEDEPFMSLLISAQSRQLNSQRGKLSREDMKLPAFLMIESPETYCQPLDILTDLDQRPSQKQKTIDPSVKDRLFGGQLISSSAVHAKSSSSCSMSSLTDYDDVCTTDVSSNVTNGSAFDQLDPRFTPYVCQLAESVQQDWDFAVKNSFNHDLHIGSIKVEDRDSVEISHGDGENLLPNPSEMTASDSVHQFDSDVVASAFGSCSAQPQSEVQNASTSRQFKSSYV